MSDIAVPQNVYLNLQAGFAESNARMCVEFEDNGIFLPGDAFIDVLRWLWGGIEGVPVPVTAISGESLACRLLADHFAAVNAILAEQEPPAAPMTIDEMIVGLGVAGLGGYVGPAEYQRICMMIREGVLALTREDGRADLVAAHRLVDLLRQARPMPRLVVLNSCSGAAAGVSDLFSGTAAALVRGGVSAVAAMQYEISDPAAVAFARGFYAAIARGRGVDDAISSGRVAILGLSDRTLEWVTPVLYLRGHDARLFTLPTPAEDINREGTQGTPVLTDGGQPGDTISPGAAGGPRRDSPRWSAQAHGHRSPRRLRSRTRHHTWLVP